MLDDISDAFRKDLPHDQLIFAPAFSNLLRDSLPDLRRVAVTAIGAGHPVPALSGAVAFLDTMTQARGTADLVQAQRDFFGRHGYVDMEGKTNQHGPWWD